MSNTCIQAVEKYLPHFRIPLNSEYPWQVIVEIINTEDALILDFLNKHMESGMIIDAIVANNEKDKTESEKYKWLYKNNFLENDPIPSIEFTYEAAHKLVPEITIKDVNELSNILINNNSSK